MITDKTVFILGAGSDNIYGFPTGSGLREYIIKDFINDLASVWDIYNEPPHPEKYQYFLFNTHPQINAKIKRCFLETAPEFIDRFKNSSNLSIDLFLSRNQKFEEIGKLAIIIKILKAERDSKFREDLDKEIQGIDWYKHIFTEMSKTLTEPDSYVNFKDNNLTFVTFNYDRSIENFIHESFYNSFDAIVDYKLVTDSNNENIPAKLIPFKFLHVYGKISDLPWQSNESIFYGANGEIEIKKYSENIKIIYDKRKSEQEIKTIKGEINNAERIYFLGFGFALENLKILEIPHLLKPGQKVYATAFNWKEKEIEKLKKNFTQNQAFNKALTLKKSELIIKNTNCLDLLRDHPPS
jgi:hypothetical protein